MNVIQYPGPVHNLLACRSGQLLHGQYPYPSELNKWKQYWNSEKLTHKQTQLIMCLSWHLQVAKIDFINLNKSLGTDEIMRLTTWLFGAVSQGKNVFKA